MQCGRIKGSHHVSSWTVEAVSCLFRFAVAASELRSDGQGHQVQSLLWVGAAEPLESSSKTGQSSDSLKVKVHSAGSSSSWASSYLRWMVRTLLRIHCLSPTHPWALHIRTLHRCYPHTPTLAQWETSPYSRSTANLMSILVPIRLRQPALLVGRQRAGRPVWRPS